MRCKNMEYTKKLEKYQFCTECKKVLVKIVFKGYDFKPVCISCREFIDKNKGGD